VAKKPARAHHYLPQFYLAGFTLSGDRNGTLWVLDREQGKSWQTRPDNIAHQRDFYRVDIEGVEPDAVEKLLAQFEGQAAEVLRRIEETRILPEGEDFDTLMNFVALQITRVPHFRQWYVGQAAYLTECKAQIALGDPAYFDQFLAEMRREGKEVPEFITRKELMEFLEDKSRYTIEIPREASIKNMAEMVQGLLPVLSQRSWSLFVAREDQGEFVCSDRPVILVPTRQNPPPFLGFGMRHTEIIMPLNRQMALVGHYLGEPQVFDADRMVVGLFNKRILDYSERFVYSPREWFTVSAPRDGQEEAGT